MSKFTPGPWETAYRKNGDGMFRQDIFDNMGSTIAVASWHPVRVDERTTRTDREDNARLIAAAPELLIACKDLMGLAERQGWAHVAINHARAAIAKAEGRQ